MQYLIQADLHSFAMEADYIGVSDIEEEDNRETDIKDGYGCVKEK